ncbi:restriction endonuclease subunit S [Xanthomonas fragariae]|uniref:restriction endonuclease subunit S n=1 Tax=Xanthomonas fragariae TaxID=48664 RepID=UPI001ABED160|nr:restriction endonuclease subunit S [Xanthomonas fragariae]UKR51973.1 restriction endonuclease subunit S [Xanthomonas fragariae]
MLPDGWRRTTLGNIGSIKSGSTPARSQQDRYFVNGKWPWVKTMDLTNSVILKTDELITDAALNESSCKIFPAGTVLVAMYGGLKQIGRTGLLQEESAVNQAISALDVERNQAHPEFILHWLNGNVEAWKNFAASSRKDPNITRENVCDFPVILPTLGEQRRIAHILSTWDQAIATTERLLANTRNCVEILSNALLTGRKRFDGHAAWQSKPLSEMICESRVVGSGGDVAKKITVKLYGKGVVGKSDKRAGSESTQYYRRSSGQFIYSKLDFLNGAFGRIPASLDGYESTLDLPAFDFLEGIDPRWFLQYVSREAFYTGHLGLANGGRKARRVNPKDLLRICVPTPCLKEQTRIADAIEAALSAVSIQERHLMLMRQEKSALMSQLLTGKRRVRLPTDEAAHA